MNIKMQDTNYIIGVLQGFKEGMTIEACTIASTRWFKLNTLEDIIEHINDGSIVRIKKSPIYRPYKSREEFFEASKKHGPYIININKGCNSKSFIPDIISDTGCHIGSNKWNGTDVEVSWQWILDHWKWQDGTSCGIKED